MVILIVIIQKVLRGTNVKQTDFKSYNQRYLNDELPDRACSSREAKVPFSCSGNRRGVCRLISAFV